VDIVLLGNLQNRLAFFGLNLFAVEFERNHLEGFPAVKSNSILGRDIRPGPRLA
jgi:hypothetical protein